MGGARRSPRRRRAASPISQSKTELPGASSWICGAPCSSAPATSVDDGRQFLVVDVDQLGGVARPALAVGDDDGDRVADIADNSVASADQAPIFIAEPSFDLTAQPQIRLPMPSPVSCLPS